MWNVDKLRSGTRTDCFTLKGSSMAKFNCNKWGVGLEYLFTMSKYSGIFVYRMPRKLRGRTYKTITKKKSEKFPGIVLITADTTF